MNIDSPQTPGESPPKSAGAVPERDRIVAIDVLRGFALLGILLMNIQAFAMLGKAYVMPTAYGDLTGANYWVWYLSHIFADQKFMSIFSMLFGAGILLMTRRQEATTDRSAAVHYRRMAALLLIGLAHAHLIWFGDILAAYALCGMLVYLFRRMSPWTLLIIGFLTIAVLGGIYWLCHFAIQYMPEKELEALRQGFQPKPEKVLEEVAAYRSGWLGQMRHRVFTALMFETVMFLTFTLWRAGGLMLIGMALFKLRILSGRSSPWLYATMIVVGFAIGVPLIIHGHNLVLQSNWDPIDTMFAEVRHNYWGSLFVALGYVGAVMLICQIPQLNWLTAPFAAVGRMALTNYLMQSIICTTVFYGHGFGYFGYIERVGQLYIVIGVWAFQLIVSPIWLQYFQFGPAEWLWRGLTYGSLPPIRRAVDIPGKS